MGDSLWTGKLSRYVSSHPGQLSLAIPPWVGAMGAGDGSVTAMEENVEFCAAVAPVTRTAGILIQLVKGLAVKVSQPSGCSGSYTGLIGFNHRWLKMPKVDELPRNGPSCLCEIFFFFFFFF